MKIPGISRPSLVLWLLGMVGVISILPSIPILLSNLPSDKPLPSMWIVISASAVQTGILVALAVYIGAKLAPRVGLASPAVAAVTSGRSFSTEIQPQIVPGILGGILGGIAVPVVWVAFLPSLPLAFIEAAEKFSPSILTRILYGGITEEILIRWGIMTLFVWLPYRFIQKDEGPVHAANYYTGIIGSALLFGMGHLPAANMLSLGLTVPLVSYVIIANSLFGIIAGYLYWKKGLESAMIAHMVAHLLMVTAESLGAY